MLAEALSETTSVALSTRNCVVLTRFEIAEEIAVNASFSKLTELLN